MKKNLLEISLITMSCLYGMLAAVIILMLVFIVALIICIATEMNSLGLPICCILFVISLFLQLSYTHKNYGYKMTNVAELLSEVKVSNITSIPCVIEGTIICRGNPGCVGCNG